MHVFRLTDFEGEQNEDIIRSKVECKDHKIERAKGKNDLYSTYLQDKRDLFDHFYRMATV